MKRNSLRTATRLLASALCVWTLGAVASAQTVRPLINELNNPAKGRVEYVNDSFTPLNVVLEAKSFSVSETGEISYRPLDPSIHLKLSTASFRIQPQQTYYVFYEASSEPSPSWFVIYANFSGFPFRTAEGMNVRLQLPHTVYLLPKQQIEKSEVQIARAELNAEQNKVVLEVANTGANFGRILEVPLDARAEGENVPVTVLLTLQNFKVEEKLQRAASVTSANTSASTET